MSDSHVITERGACDARRAYAVASDPSPGPALCEIQFTLLRQPHTDDSAFARDGEWITRDLQSLKRLLEAAA